MSYPVDVPVPDFANALRAMIARLCEHDSADPAHLAALHVLADDLDSFAAAVKSNMEPLVVLSCIAAHADDFMHSLCVLMQDEYDSCESGGLWTAIGLHVGRSKLFAALSSEATRKALHTVRTDRVCKRETDLQDDSVECSSVVDLVSEALVMPSTLQSIVDNMNHECRRGEKDREARESEADRACRAAMSSGWWSPQGGEA